MIEVAANKIKIGVSSCLLGHKVRYDGQHQYHPLINQTLAEGYELLPFCPEVEIGLGVPRNKIQLVEINQQIICVDEPTRKIDYTQKLKNCCEQQIFWLKKLNGYILKTKSPSCGITQVKTDHQGSIRPDGQGIFARRLRELFPQLPLIEETQFEQASARDHFLKEVKRYVPI